MLRLIGTGTTDSNGVATCNYTGKGNGLIDVVAKCREVTSNEIEVCDCLFYDEATSNAKASQYVNGDSTNVAVTYSDNGTLLNCTATSGTKYYSTKIGDIVSWRDTSINYRIECDYTYDNTDGGIASVIFGNARMGLSSLNNSATTGTGHITIISTGNTYIIKNNGSQVGNAQTMSNTDGFKFTLYAKCKITFKNLKIYPV